MKNYYQILNIKPTATIDDIKRNYRVLAKKYHPDINVGDRFAADRFANINEAYETLSDQKLRAEYDAKLREAAMLQEQNARQVAAQQAAARQAAMKNPGSMAGHQSSDAGVYQNARHDAQPGGQPFAAANRQQQVNGSGVNSQQIVQQQFAAIKNMLFQSGYERGKAETQRVADRDISKLAYSLKSITAQYTKLKGESEELRSAKKLLELDNTRHERELAREKSRVTELERQLQVATKSIERLQAKSQALTSSEKTNEIKAAREEIKKLQYDNRGLELECRRRGDLEKKIARQLQSEVDKLQSKVDGLTAALEKAREEKKKALMRNTAGANNTQAVIKKMEEDKNRAILDVKAQVDAEKKRTEIEVSKNKQLRDEIERLKSKIEGLNAIAEKARADGKDAAKSEEELKRANEKISRLEAEKSKFESVKARLSDERNKNERLQTENGELKAKVDELRSKIGEIKTAYEKKRENAVQKNDEDVIMLREELKRAKESNKRQKLESEKTLFGVKNQLEIEQNNVKRLHDQIESLEGEISVLNCKLANSNATDNLETEDYERVCAELRASQERIRELEELNLSIVQSMDKVKSQSNMSEELQSEISVLNDKVKEINDALEKVRSVQPNAQDDAFVDEF